KRAVNKSGADAPLIELLDLILHQRNQWRNNYRQPFKHHSRNLITERFSTARWKEHHGITTLQNRGYCFVLSFAKRGVAPIFLKGFPGVIHQFFIHLLLVLGLLFANKIQIIIVPVNQEVNIHKNILHLFTETLIYAVMKLDGRHIALALSNSPAVADILPVLPLRPIRRPRALLGS